MPDATVARGTPKQKQQVLGILNRAKANPLAPSSVWAWICEDCLHPGSRHTRARTTGASGTAYTGLYCCGLCPCRITGDDLIGLSRRDYMTYREAMQPRSAEVDCATRERFWADYGDRLKPYSTLTDPDGQYGSGVVYTEWGVRDAEKPWLRDYRWTGERCRHYMPIANIAWPTNAQRGDQGAAQNATPTDPTLAQGAQTPNE